MVSLSHWIIHFYILDWNPSLLACLFRISLKLIVVPYCVKTYYTLSLVILVPSLLGLASQNDWGIHHMPNASRAASHRYHSSDVKVSTCFPIHRALGGRSATLQALRQGFFGLYSAYSDSQEVLKRMTDDLNHWQIREFLSILLSRSAKNLSV